MLTANYKSIVYLFLLAISLVGCWHAEPSPPESVVIPIKNWSISTLSVLPNSKPAIKVRTNTTSFDFPTLNIDASAVSAFKPINLLQTTQENWWNRLNDPLINQANQATLISNPTLIQALSRIEEAKAVISGTKASGLPSIDAQINPGLSNTRLWGNVVPLGLVLGPSQTNSAKIGLSWELDLFGKVRNSVEQANYQLNARNADAESMKLALTSQVATTVVSLRTCQAIQANLSLQRSSLNRIYQLTQKKYLHGFLPSNKPAEMLKNLADLDQQSAQQQKTCEQTTNALIALSGLDRETIQSYLTNLLYYSSSSLPPITPEVPAIVLTLHPDIQSANFQLLAQWKASEGAKLSYLPDINLAAVLTGQWIKAGGSIIKYGTGLLSPGLSANLWNSGKTSADIKIAQAQYKQAAGKLEQTMRTTVQEIENALAAQIAQAKSWQAIHRNMRAQQVIFTTVQANTKKGLLSDIELQQSRYQFLQAKANEMLAIQDCFIAWINLVKSTGNSLAVPIITSSSRYYAT